MLDKTKQYWFIGVKGTGMASLALIMYDLGFNVAGSDIDMETFTQRPLEDRGIVIKSSNRDNITPAQVIVKGNAFKEENPEVTATLEMKVSMHSYPNTVEEIIQQYTSIGIGGARGKTPTTALLLHILTETAPTSYLVSDDKGRGVKGSRFFVHEADEYWRYFLAYHPGYQTMTNIDFDHPDYFKDTNDTQSAFQSAANQARKTLSVWGDDPRLQKTETKIPKYAYGFKDSDDFQAYNVKRSTDGTSFSVRVHSRGIGEFRTHLFGGHNIMNSFTAIEVVLTEEVPMEDIQEGLLTYDGTKRHFSEKDFGDITVIDDYAHHPTEIKATIQAAKQKFPDEKLVVVLQPHACSRAKEFASELIETLRGVDKTYTTLIFGSAREKSGDISSEDLTNQIPGNEVIDIADIADLTKNRNSVVVFMGAGDTEKYGDAFEKLI